ncbi:hypothetical protein SELMODRAFT_134679 [Selaginella moellendorffii]|uniref:Uncharacterized protein n=1 Tax=Selaginella moellendorffii TaxID=88036 RepID=D8T8W3_SELML|nr:protein NUCLEAR FUSION DEFECTIVE 4 [Selaginella moellendorffii]EFJ06898.1 hypothetical protein SELMODRAFT_134679 [Selaginella moellendorffii]|eukprot:XP_002992049.1 protein NUCLEAR FUSION DEFECTIVE 4 [Selaginella moellendorffii]
MKLSRQHRSVWNSRWLVLVASIWIQACAGVGYVYGSYSPLIKSRLHFNQKQMNILGVAKDMGDSVGIFAGSLSDVIPPWGLVFLGSLQNFVGYGGIWLIVTNPALPSFFWLMCVLMFVGTNGETYFNTVALVSSVRNFPRNRGPVVGILKGFTGLCGAIFTLVYGALLSPNQAAFILLVAVAPVFVGLLVMPIIRPIETEAPVTCEEKDKEEAVNLGFIYNLCLIMAGYLLVVLLVQDLLDVSKLVTGIFALGMFILIVLPLAIPLKLETQQLQEAKLTEPLVQAEAGAGSSQATDAPVYDPYFSELEDEKRAARALPERVVHAKLQRMQSNLYRAVAEGAIKVKRRKGPRRGEDFTLRQALVKADFLLMFFALFCGAGSGVTAIDNLGQMGQAQGYPNAHIFVSMMSIWNFLGRVGGGFVSEWVVRDYAYPRPLVLAGAQLVMAVGHFFYAMAWPASLYIGSLLVGLGYGAHWAIAPSTVSELFGLKNFGSLYNFLTVANPLASLLFSGVIAGSIYDSEAEKQFGMRHRDHHHHGGQNNGLHCKGAVCFRMTFLILMGVCILGSGLCMLLVRRTMRVYAGLYGKQLPQQQQSDQLGSIAEETETRLK